MSNESGQQSILNGLALGVTFVIVSSFLYFNPGYLYYDIVSYIVGAIFGLLGFIGLILEVSKIDEQYKKSIDYIGVSILIGMILYSIGYFISNFIMNLILILFWILPIFGLLLGIFQIIKLIVNEKTIKKALTKLSVFTLNIVIFILTVLQILQVLKDFK